jgi:hypothetical protein
MPRKRTPCHFIGNHTSAVDGRPRRGMGFWCEDVPMDEPPPRISDPTSCIVSWIGTAASLNGFAAVPLNNNLVCRRSKPKEKESGR